MIFPTRCIFHWMSVNFKRSLSEENKIIYPTDKKLADILFGIVKFLGKMKFQLKLQTG